jgi:hypothetical protein
LPPHSFSVRSLHLQQRGQGSPGRFSKCDKQWHYQAAASHGVEHVVETTGQPVFAKARRLDPDKLRAAEAEFKALEAAGIVRRSDSHWSSSWFQRRMVPGGHVATTGG